MNPTPQPKSEEDVDEDRVGFNLGKENLRCLVVLNDDLAQAMSDRAGNAFWRGFIVEDNKTGEIWGKYRFRYQDHDSWFHMHLSPERRKMPVAEQVQFFADAYEKVLGAAMAMMAGTAKDLDEALGPNNGTPKGLITCFYPPNPKDPDATLQWLIDQDLVEIKSIEVTTPDGKMNVPTREA